MAPAARDVDAEASHDGLVTNGSDDGMVRLELPVDSRYIRVARLVASGLGATAGLDVDGVDDLRIAVDELCAALFEVGDATRSVELTFAVRPGEVEVNGRASTVPSAEFDADRLVLSRQILDVACDAYSLTLDDGVAVFSVRKHVS
jgi:hypothetical protein